MNQDIKNKLDEALEVIRDYLRRDEGDVELVDFDEKNKIVKVRLLGNCKVCDMNDFTFQFGIRRTLFAKVPEIKDVIIVEDDK